ncbi:MAG: hypothetical protein NXI31_07545 [bacterium]|nr:hypothetical protein [bacterium]
MTRSAQYPGLPGPGFRSLAGCVLLLLMGTGCASPRDAAPAINEIYREAAHTYVRNPVIVIHGILGSRLEQESTGKTVWGAFTGTSIDPATPAGAQALALPMSKQLAGLDQDVYASGPLQAIELDLFFTVVSVGVYANILRTLGVGGYSDPVAVDPESPAYFEDHYTCWTFFYDWRRDCVENAIAFGDYLTATRARIQRSATERVEDLRQKGDAASLQEADEIAAWLASDWRFDIVAHSMGGLVARYYLRYGQNGLPADGSAPPVTWAGAEQIDRLVLVGTPNFGSMLSLSNLLDGFQPAPLLPHYDRALLGTMASIYQLLPRNGQGLVLDSAGEPLDFDLYDVANWEQNDWGLLDPDSEEYLEWLLPDEPDAAKRRMRAREIVANNLARAKQFHRALDQDAPTRSPAELRLFAADTVDTVSRVRLHKGGDGKFRARFGGAGALEYGDGTVPRFSALANRKIMSRGFIDSPVRWDSVTFLPDDHIGITQNPLFTNNLLFYLLQQRPRR